MTALVTAAAFAGTLVLVVPILLPTLEYRDITLRGDSSENSSRVAHASSGDEGRALDAVGGAEAVVCPGLEPLVTSTDRPCDASRLQGELGLSGAA
jgi:hypothetical protein